MPLLRRRRLQQLFYFICSAWSPLWYFGNEMYFILKLNYLFTLGKQWGGLVAIVQRGSRYQFAHSTALKISEISAKTVCSVHLCSTSLNIPEWDNDMKIVVCKYDFYRKADTITSRKCLCVCYFSVVCVGSWWWIDASHYSQLSDLKWVVKPQNEMGLPFLENLETWI